MSTEITSELTIIDSSEHTEQHHNPMIGLVGFMGGFAGLGAVFVAVTRQDVGVVAQMGVVAAMCGAIAATMARLER